MQILLSTDEFNVDPNKCKNKLKTKFQAWTIQKAQKSLQNTVYVFCLSFL